jgi:pimeloyl-ACP methyl ester carboxylesterase
MHVLVNGVRLFFDVEGAKLVPDGPAMREKPTLLLLHGGPGSDHSIYRPAYSALADIAQVIYLDHRGNGRSEDGPRESWNLAQWGDDVRAFCDVLGIANPIVLGASFGGMVALAYATRHPAIPPSWCSSAPQPLEVRIWTGVWRCSNASAARKSVPWRATVSWKFRVSPTRPRSTPGSGWPFRSIRASRDPDMARRAINRSEVLQWFVKPGGESHSFNMFPDLDRIRCPILVLGGEDDPIHPIESQADIAAALPAHLVQFERFANCRHAVIPDAPEQAMAVIRDFLEHR